MCSKKIYGYDARMKHFELFLEDLAANAKRLPTNEREVLEWLRAIIYDAVLCGEQIERELND